jgi:hypothetical protein
MKVTVILTMPLADLVAVTSFGKGLLVTADVDAESRAQSSFRLGRRQPHAKKGVVTIENWNTRKSK